MELRPMYEDTAFREIARAQTRDALNTPAFRTLSLDDQREMFRNVYAQSYRALTEAHSNGRGGARSRAMEGPSVPAI
jgi:hypothetical protein